MTCVNQMRLPAEWEAQAAVWVVSPHNRETWPGCFGKACEQFEAFVAALGRYTTVREVGELGIETDDSWIRDFGPVFTWASRLPQPAHHRSSQPAERELIAHDFAFDTWGGKYEPRPLDDAVAGELARALGLESRRHERVLEAGAIESNGRGTLLTTTSCLLDANRNPGVRREQVEADLGPALGVNRWIWLEPGPPPNHAHALQGDDTAGHIDTLARFVGPRTVLAVSAPPGHPDHALSASNLRTLRHSHDERGRRLEVIELPAPPPRRYDYPPDRFGRVGPAPIPASYANFLISNDAVFVPTFGEATDEPALTIIDTAMPRHHVVPIRAEWLCVGQGTLHCLTMPQPAGA